MKYVKVKWLHSHLDEPVLLYSELNDEMWETRKVEVYADGRANFADSEGRSGSTKLGVEPYPTLEDIATDPQFEPVAVSQAEFEEVWGAARRL